MDNNKHSYDVDAILASSTISKRQRECFETLRDAGTVAKSAKVLGLNKRSLQAILARGRKLALAEGVDKYVPNKQVLGGTSTLYKTDEETGEKVEVMQWVKTKSTDESTLEAIQQVTSELAKEVDGKAKPIKKPKKLVKDLLVAYVSTDIHLGQFSWAPETGENVDVDSVKCNVINSMYILTETTPSAEEAIVLDLGDTLHAANDDARTKSGHVLDVDGRHAKVFKALVDMKLEMIDLALKKHARVTYIIVAGNHSDLVPNYLIAMLSAYYRNEPRLTVNCEQGLHKYYKHGETLLGFHHGHATKMQRLPEVMVWDRKEDISSTTHRYWLTGHVHKDSVVDNPIARCESFRNATHNDAWASGAGYRGHKQTVAITYSKKYGEIARNIVPIDLVKASVREEML